MNERLLLLFLLFFGWVNAGNLAAQDLPPMWNDGTAESRFQSIYEKGEWRPTRFNATWWANSAGFSVRTRDPKTRNPIIEHFDAATGLKAISTPPNVDEQSLGRSRDGRSQIEVRNGNIFLTDTETQTKTKLTKWKPRPEVRIRNASWNSSGTHIAFIESNSRDVRRRSMLIPTDPSYPTVRERQFARVGEKITANRIGLLNVETQKTQWLAIKSPPEGFYLGTVEWSGDELLIEWLSRGRDQREFFLASTDGKLKSIFRESDPAWVVASQARNSGLHWIQDGKEFIVISEKDGWRHAYRYSRGGDELASLTPGEYDIIEKAAVDEVNGWFYFYASPNNATDRYLHRVPLDGSGKREQITPANQLGTHAYNFSPNFKWAFHTHSTFDKPPVIELLELESHQVLRILETNEQLVSLANKFIATPTEFLKLDIGGDIQMDAWMIKPQRFDSTKKYPVFVYVYGEPHAQTVLNEWGAAQSHFLRVVADLGYLVVSIDNRGTPSPKGAAWRRAIFGSLGPLSTEEQAAGLKELARIRPFVDLSRVGIWGWSGGGSNTLNALFRKPDDYHVGIAVVPKPQPHLYNAWFQEIFMRTRVSNPDGYQRSAPINFAEGLQGKLLIVTGSGETNTHIQIIEGLVDRLVELGKQFDYMVYPNRDHGLAEGAGTRVHVRMLITRFLLEHLSCGPQ